MAEKRSEMFTKKEVANRCKVHVNTVNGWLASKKLACHRFGRKCVRIAQEQLDAFLAITDTTKKAKGGAR